MLDATNNLAAPAALAAAPERPALVAVTAEPSDEEIEAAREREAFDVETGALPRVPVDSHFTR